VRRLESLRYGSQSQKSFLIGAPDDGYAIQTRLQTDPFSSTLVHPSDVRDKRYTSQKRASLYRTDQTFDYSTY
jgi:hypothetical protein